jgi:hypothetical protein
VTFLWASATTVEDAEVQVQECTVQQLAEPARLYSYLSSS